MSIFNWFSKNKPKEETPAAQEEQAAQTQAALEKNAHRVSVETGPPVYREASGKQ